MAVKYIRCPRCELNYIADTAEICDVCKVEMNILSGVDEEIEDDDFTKEVCPICKRNFINFDEEMCDRCIAEKAKSNEENDVDWRSFLDDEGEVVLENDIITLDELEEEELLDEKEDDEEEFPSFSVDDDLEEIDLDDIDDLDDDLSDEDDDE